MPLQGVPGRSATCSTKTTSLCSAQQRCNSGSLAGSSVSLHKTPAQPQCSTRRQRHLSSRGSFWVRQSQRGSRRRLPKAGRITATVEPPPGPSSRRTRLASRIVAVPRRVDLYFERNWPRQALWAGVAFGTGFYCANTVSLSFGALAINDVVAAAVTVAFCEVVSYIYYAAPKATLRLIFINSFKMGVIAALISDALKLGG